CAMLLDARRLDGPGATEVRAQALRQADPVRFHTLLAGAYTPAWATAIHGSGGKVYIMITLERPDWRALNELMSTFRKEARMAVSSTRGHAELIVQMVRKLPKGANAEELSKRVLGFAEIMATHMYRLEMLMDLLQRLEMIRTGQLLTDVRKETRKIQLANFVEDFLEETVDEALIDPSRTDDLRDRLKIQIPSSLVLAAA